eukprot:jgi/Psemu1/60760/gm1.60760_g
MPRVLSTNPRAVRARERRAAARAAAANTAAFEAAFPLPAGGRSLEEIRNATSLLDFQNSGSSPTTRPPSPPPPRPPAGTRTGRIIQRLETRQRGRLATLERARAQLGEDRARAQLDSPAEEQEEEQEPLESDDEATAKR